MNLFRKNSDRNQRQKALKSQKRHVKHLALLAGVAIASVFCLNDYANEMQEIRHLCEEGRPEDVRRLVDDRNLASSIVAYINEVISSENNICETDFPDRALWDEYPPIQHYGGPIPNRPYGTIAYVLTIIRCPGWYEPGVDGTPDPGEDLFEMTAVIKDEICNATDTANELSDSDFMHTLYAIVNPNGVICPKPGERNEEYDRVTMLQDMGYRIEIVGQPITNDHLIATQPYIEDNIESDVGIRDSTKLHIFRLIEHPVAVLFDYDTLLQFPIDSLVTNLENDDDLKGYYVRTPSCDGIGNSLVDTGFMAIKPSMEEFDNIREAYINTPYDPVLGWNSQGHHHCDGRLGLPGFFSYYFSITPGYVELDRCEYSFIADEECINAKITESVKPASEIADIVENGPKTIPPSTPEANAVNEAAKSSPDTIDEVRVEIVDGSNGDLTTTLTTEMFFDRTITVITIYVQTIVSFLKVTKTISIDGVSNTEVVLENNFTTTKTLIDKVVTNPNVIEAPDIVEEPAAESIVTSACKKPKILKKTVDICGEPTDCPPDDPSWSTKQRLACQQLHSKYFQDKRRTELKMKKMKKCELIGQFKQRSFHGYCKGPGPQNYLGLKDAVVEPKPEWQNVCEPMICPYGTFVSEDCTCSPFDDPCDACPSGTRCQLEPVYMCIDCECGFCDSDGAACCDFNDVNNCKNGNNDKNCNMKEDFFAAFQGTGNVCTGVEISTTATPNGCGCQPNKAGPCTYNPALQDAESSCFICTVDDLAEGKCPACTSCLSAHGDCINYAETADDFSTCLKTNISPEDRAICHDMCKKL